MKQPRLLSGDEFDSLIGRLDRVLSEMVDEGRKTAHFYDYDQIDRQTLKHHAEDMILAGNKILKDLGQEKSQ